MKKISKIIVANFTLFTLGCIVALFSFLLVFFIEYSEETFHLNNSISLLKLFKSTVYCLCVAIIEEFVFRYLFLRKWLKDRYKPFHINLIYLCVISSVIFGFLHMAMDLFPIFQINLTLAGVSLFYATYKLRNISIAIGMHFFGNFIQGVVFPFQGSGSNLENIFVLESNAVFFPEASYYLCVSLLLEIVLITVIANSKYFTSNFIPKSQPNIDA